MIRIRHRDKIYKKLRTNPHARWVRQYVKWYLKTINNVSKPISEEKDTCEKPISVPQIKKRKNK